MALSLLSIPGSRGAPMDPTELRQFAKRYTAAWCSQDAKSVASFYAANGSLRINQGEPSVGREAITAAAQGFMSDFPDMVVRMDDVRGDGRQAVYRWTLTGTHSGPGGTGRNVRISGYEEWTIGADGLIAESRGHFDEGEYRRQLEGRADSSPDLERARKEVHVQRLARGTFEVKLTPVAGEEGAPGTALGRMAIDKRFHGDIEGSSKGEMLTAITGVEGSAGYVAIERVTGTISGRKGSFVLQHDGVMTRGVPELSVVVVPDSGTQELAGIGGRMTIQIENGKHFYELEYTLAGSP